MTTKSVTKLQAGTSPIYETRTDMILVTSALWSLLQGNPDEDNARRVDDATLQGIVTPQGIKYKLRYVAAQHGQNLFIRPGGSPLELLTAKALKDVGVDPTEVVAESDGDGDDGDNPKKKKGKKGRVLSQAEIQAVSKKLCEDYFDVRAFGAVLCKPVNAPITGPVQVSFSMSVAPVFSHELGITRGVVTKVSDLQEKDREMGRMPIVPFEVSLTRISIDPFRARATGFTHDDFELLITGIRQMYDMTRSTLRSGVCAEKLVIFRHADKYGNGQAMKLFRRVKVKTDVPGGAPYSRSFSDWTVEVDETGLSGVTVEIIDL